MIKSFSITVYGRVQGVGFRYHAMRQAGELNINGFIQNQYDGTVYLEAEGEEQNLNAFIEWCRHGPSRAHVDEVDIQSIELKKFTRFGIK